VTTVDAGAGITAGAALEDVGAAVGTSTGTRFGLVFVDVLPRASVPGTSSFEGVVAAPVDDVEVDGVVSVVASDADEPVVVLVC
jgi:hypothetical protein